MDKTEEEKHEILTYCQKAADLDQSKFFLLDYCNLDNFCAQEFMSMYCFFLFGKLARKIYGRFWWNFDIPDMSFSMEFLFIPDRSFSMEFGRFDKKYLSRMVLIDQLLSTKFFISLIKCFQGTLVGYLGFTKNVLFFWREYLFVKLIGRFFGNFSHFPDWSFSMEFSIPSICHFWWKLSCIWIFLI